MSIKLFSFACLIFLTTPLTALAASSPIPSPNNRFGIHILAPTTEEIESAASLVNSNGGDWGYVTAVIEARDRDWGKWQKFFDSARRAHLIPIMRIATEPAGEVWRRPKDGEEKDWADFLDSLNWPTKNRYVVLYNEPNHGAEWGGSVDAGDYARTLDKTITAFKDKSPDFLVLNAGLDASAPYKLPAYQDEISFIEDMQKAVPGIFNLLDGWSSHSYPNPDFSGSPTDIGLGSVNTWRWELSKLQSLRADKTLPIFITETGWRHAEGVQNDHSYYTSTQVAQFIKTSFNGAWNDNQVAAVTPFLLDSQQPPFDHFSFKKLEGKVLGTKDDKFYPAYSVIQSLDKVKGSPVQTSKAQLVEGEIYSSIVSDQSYEIKLKFKNTGQSIWNESDNKQITLKINSSSMTPFFTAQPESQTKVEPGQFQTFIVSFTAPKDGRYDVKLQLYGGDKEFDSSPFEFKTEVKPPVSLKVKGSLSWKKIFAGKYTLQISDTSPTFNQNISLDTKGVSDLVTLLNIVPDHLYNLTLTHQDYNLRTVKAVLKSGENSLEFPPLSPDILHTIIHPRRLWQLLPFSQ